MSRLLRFDDVEIDLESFRLTRAGEPLQVEPKSLKLLVFLAENPGRLVTRQQLIDAVWGDAFVTDHVLNRAIGQLRKALNDDPKNPRIIETVPTLGYRFIAKIEPVPAISTQNEDSAALSPGRSPQSKDSGGSPGTTSQTASRTRVGFLILIAAVLLILGVASHSYLRARTAATRVRSLAVLPLKNLSGDASQEYLADGMTEQLTTDLGQIAALTVISPTTAMQYKDPHKSLPQIAAELHVDAVVEGSVTRSGDQLRIDAQLIDAHADRQLWARSFQGSRSDALSLQNQVASAVADEIRVQVSAQERTQLADSRPTNPQAYEALLKGYYFENLNTPESIHKSQQYFMDSARLDPTFARAHVGIARSYNFLADFGLIPSGEATASADAELAKALELDPNLGEAYAERGWMELFYHWDMPDAARDFRYAIQLDPGGAEFHQGLGHYLIRVGDQSQAFKEFDRSIELDPLSRRDQTDYCYVLMLAKHYDEARRHCQTALELDPHFDYGLMTLQELDERIGNYDAAHELVKQLGWCSDDLCMAAADEIHGRPGTAGSWDRWVKTLKQLPDPVDAAFADTALHRNDQAFADLEKLYEQHRAMQFLTFLNIDPFFATLYSDPRFDAFLKHAGLPPRPAANH